jgi:hypothetical protein
MAVLTYKEFLKESEDAPDRVKAKWQDKIGSIDALDYTSTGQNDLIEFRHNGNKKMVPRHELTPLD